MCSGGKLPSNVQRFTIQKIPIIMEKTGISRREEENSGVITRSVECAGGTSEFAEGASSFSSLSGLQLFLRYLCLAMAVHLSHTMT